MKDKTMSATIGKKTMSATIGDDSLFNGINVFIASRLGLDIAGDLWLPLPEGGVSAEDLHYIKDYLSTKTGGGINTAYPKVKCLSIKIPDWEGVFNWISEEKAKDREAEVKAIAAAAHQAELEVKENEEVLAAISNPEESNLLYLHLNFYWAAKYVSQESNAKLLRDEADKRTQQLRDSWLLLPDQEFKKSLGLTNIDYRDSAVIKQLPQKVQDRYLAILDKEERERQEELRTAISQYVVGDQLLRYDAGVLSEIEKMDLLDKSVFFEVTQKLKVWNPLTDSNKPIYHSRSYSETLGLTSDEFSSWIEAKNLIESIEGAKAELKITLIQCSNCTHGFQYLLKCQASKWVAGILVTHDYGVGVRSLPALSHHLKGQ